MTARDKAKGKQQDWDVSKMEEGTASVHGVVVELSPIKCSRSNSSNKYFNGKVTDGIKVAQ